MMMSDDKVGGWVKKGQNHDDVILECPLTEALTHKTITEKLKLMFSVSMTLVDCRTFEL